MTKPEIYVFIEHLRGQVADIAYVMLAAAQSIAAPLNGSVVALLFDPHAQEMANDLAADRVWCFDHPRLADYAPSAYLRLLTGLIHENQPRLVLFGDTSIGADLAGTLSARLGLPLVSNCRSLQAEAGALKYTSQICGGKIMVEGELPGPTALATMIPGAFKAEQGQSSQPPVVVWGNALDLEDLPIRFDHFIEPDLSDVDISKEPVLVSVGRGIQNQDNLELAQELVEVLHGVLTASRPVVDLGWLPTTRLVGRSGKRIKPALYLALGISGAPEHVEAITDSETIIAINTDPEAPIFNLARYGATVDILDLMPALTEKTRQAQALASA
jgi:electron transfer flavoprotein alpha subunit